MNTNIANAAAFMVINYNSDFDGRALEWRNIAEPINNWASGQDMPNEGVFTGFTASDFQSLKSTMLEAIPHIPSKDQNLSINEQVAYQAWVQNKDAVSVENLTTELIKSPYGAAMSVVSDRLLGSNFQSLAEGNEKHRHIQDTAEIVCA